MRSLPLHISAIVGGSLLFAGWLAAESIYSLFALPQLWPLWVAQLAVAAVSASAGAAVMRRARVARWLMLVISAACAVPFLYFARSLLAGLLYVLNPPPDSYGAPTFSQWLSASGGMFWFLIPAAIAIFCTVVVFRFFRVQNAL